MAGAMLPLQQRATTFQPPTQSLSQPTVGVDYSKKSSRVVGVLTGLVTRTSWTKSTSSSSGSGGSFQASDGSFQAVKTPQMLWPQTPTPIAGHTPPRFDWQPGSSVRPSNPAFIPQAPVPELQQAMRVVPHTLAPAAQWMQTPGPTMMPLPLQPAVRSSQQEAKGESRGFGANEQAGNAMSSASTSTSTWTQAADMSASHQQTTRPILLGRMGSPSVGSSLHGTGKCQPCAWFWKKGRGCQDGINCDHCHLCPEGELKARKKSKIIALRSGALQPHQGSVGAGPMHRGHLNLTRLVGRS